MKAKATKTLTGVENIAAYAWLSNPASFAVKLSQGKFKRYEHIKYLTRKITPAILKGGGRFLITMPPRHGKSTLVSEWLPVWFLELFPDKNVMLASYEADFAASWGRKVRNHIDNNQEHLSVQIASDSSAADRWHTKQEGGMFTAGIGGPFTGRGGHLLIIDDYVKNWEQAMSASFRKKSKEWFDSTFYTRAEPGATIIVMATRWHEDDLIGYLLNDHDDDWVEIRLPALAEEDDALSRPIGQALCDDRFTAEDLARIERGVGSRVWNALYQGRPSAEEGNIFKRGWWQYWKALPSKMDTTIMGWDMTFKETKSGSYVVGQVWGRYRADKYLIDQVRLRTDFPGTIRVFKSFVAKHPYAHVKLVEDKANGPAVIDTLKREINGIIPVETDGSKEARAYACSSDVEAGNVYLPDPSLPGYDWVHDYVEELASFPNGANDDQVDCTSMCLRRLMTQGIAYSPITVSGSYGNGGY